jgi:hypothetical protein
MSFFTRRTSVASKIRAHTGDKWVLNEKIELRAFCTAFNNSQVKAYEQLRSCVAKTYTIQKSKTLERGAVLNQRASEHVQNASRHRI